MPELPEVETVCRGLAPVLEGYRLTSVEIRRKNLRKPFPKGMAARLTGKRVERLTRRAKYILAEIEGGQTLVIHLGMSGRMAVYAEGGRQKLGAYVFDPPPDGAGTGKHDHVVFETDAPAKIVFTDPRRFGLMTLVPTAQLNDDPLFAKMGIEPLSNHFHDAFLATALKGKKTPIKSALLDQSIIAGIGNIYACEALFRAHLSPKRMAMKLRGGEVALLCEAIRQVLIEAIAAGGSSISDHRQADGTLGYFQHAFRVYGREGEPCVTCGAPIKRIVQAGRSTFFCGTCQT